MQRLRGAGCWEVSRGQASGEPEVCRVVAEHGKGGSPESQSPASPGNWQGRPATPARGVVLGGLELWVSR